jgi:multiple sugar transport system substrate-binding protein
MIIQMKTINLMLVMTLFSGCGDSSEEKEQVRLVVKCPTLMMNSVSDESVVDTQDFLNRAASAFAAQYEEVDVTIDVCVFDYVDELDAVAGSFDTDDAMDVLYEDYFNMASYIYTGRVVSLDDIITDSIREDIDEVAWDLSTVNGKTYMMPYLSRQNVLMYNKKLMRDCGLENYISDNGIQNWTMEEWTEILDTLAQNLPEGTYPMMMYAKNNQGDTHIMSFIRAFGGELIDENGSFDFESDEAVSALEWISSGVEKGWYPPHSENLEIADAQELFDNNQLVFYVFNNANSLLYDNLDDYGFVNFPGNVATSFVTGFEVFDNGDEKTLEAAKAFVKYIYETDELLELSAGNIPVSKKTIQKYSDSIVMLDDFEANSDNVADFISTIPNWQGTDTSVRSVFWKNIHQLLSGKTTPEECAKALDEDCNEAVEIGRKNSVLHE